MIKSKDRVQLYGEVFTPVRTVNDMLNMEGLKTEVENIKNTVLEPSVGDGIFLVEILKRRFRKILDIENDLSEIENKFILAIETIYGIELLEDNVLKCRENIYNCFIYYYNLVLKEYDVPELKITELFNNIQFVIEKNIIQGNFLTGKNSKDEDIDFLNKKFDIIIGNPPYQEIVDNNDNENNCKRIFSKQIFLYFIMKSIDMKANMVSFIVPSRWFAGSCANRVFEKLITFIKNNNKIKELHYFPNSFDVFENVSIKGGVCYFLWDYKHSGDTMFSTHKKDIKEDIYRPLFYRDLDMVIKDKIDIEVLDKILSLEFTSLSNIAGKHNPFGVSGKEAYVEKISSCEPFENSIELRCKGNQIRYIDKKYILKNVDLCVNKYKVFISKSSGSPDKDFKVLVYPYIGVLNTACTDSLITIGNFETIEEAENLRKYICTKFLRYIVNIVKASHNVYKNVYCFVPIQDFTNNSDIDWNKSIDEIDEQLFLKYKLNEKQIDYIKQNIKTLE